MKRRTISKLAREAGVGIETVRFYEKRGILKQPDAPAEGWREYGDEALETIRYIKIGQQMGFKLAEMQRLQQK
ncbi:MAG TPA: MerR family transcriptional regulator, partial [Terriglobales bacterium]|nr:MerR family transcriptional regulator [Terriglobales bacterium]